MKKPQLFDEAGSKIKKTGSFQGACFLYKISHHSHNETSKSFEA